MAAVRGKEVIDDALTVLTIDGTQAGESSEREWPHELTQDQLRVEFIEVGAGFGALQKAIERLAILVDDSCPQRLPIVGFLGAVRCWAKRDPGQCGDVQRCLLEQRGLSAQQFDELVAQRSRPRRRVDLRQQPFKCGGQQLSGAAEVAIQGRARDFGGFGDRVNGDGFDAAGAEECGGSIQ